jgi:hypothetical protein
MEGFLEGSALAQCERVSENEKPPTTTETISIACEEKNWTSIIVVNPSPFLSFFLFIPFPFSKTLFSSIPDD